MSVDPTAFEKLCEIEDRIVPVSVVGLYRTGKSYLLNRLAGKSSGLSALVVAFDYINFTVELMCKDTFRTSFVHFYF